MTTLKDIADACAQLPEGSRIWVEELIDELAKLDCKTRKEIPSWTALSAQQRTACRKRAENQLVAIADFFQKKLSGENRDG